MGKHQQQQHQQQLAGQQWQATAAEAAAKQRVLRMTDLHDSSQNPAVAVPRCIVHVHGSQHSAAVAIDGWLAGRLAG
jgi:hypothetical protein